MSTSLTTANLKAKISDPGLRIEILDPRHDHFSSLALAYIDGLADSALVKLIKSKLLSEMEHLHPGYSLFDALTGGRRKWHPYPLVRYLEALDDVVLNLRTGHLVVLSENELGAAAVPTSFFDLLRAPTDHGFQPLVRLLVRLLRTIGVAISVFLTPLWLVVSLHPGLLPAPLKFLALSGLEVGQIGLLWQLLVAELVFNLGRLLIAHRPNHLEAPILLIGLILAGQLGVGVGLFAPEMVFYTALVALGVLSTPEVHLSWANTVARIVLVIGTGIFGLTGFILVTVSLIVLLASTKSFGLPYLWPLIPFDWPAMVTLFTGTRSGMRQAIPVPARKPHRD